MPEIAEFAEILGLIDLPMWQYRWQDDAACKGYPTSWWFPETGASRECHRAKAICASCPVQIQCREDALNHHDQHGLFGGMSLKDRRRWGNERKAG
ncbi:WhiB family transcriptional regulator [Mycobacteroides chelonae]|nr:WhiB family transcriptional regulator [Mycobacteroides chelonae]